jgi:hypothetical protein
MGIAVPAARHRCAAHEAVETPRTLEFTQFTLTTRGNLQKRPQKKSHLPPCTVSRSSTVLYNIDILGDPLVSSCTHSILAHSPQPEPAFTHCAATTSAVPASAAAGTLASRAQSRRTRRERVDRARLPGIARPLAAHTLAAHALPSQAAGVARAPATAERQSQRVGQCSLVRDGRGCNCCVIASSWLAKVVRQP